jgi:hypothetical protein
MTFTIALKLGGWFLVLIGYIVSGVVVVFLVSHVEASTL